MLLGWNISSLLSLLGYLFKLMGRSPRGDYSSNRVATPAAYRPAGEGADAGHSPRHRDRG